MGYRKGGCEGPSLRRPDVPSEGLKVAAVHIKAFPVVMLWLLGVLGRPLGMLLIVIAGFVVGDLIELYLCGSVLEDNVQECDGQVVGVDGDLVFRGDFHEPVNENGSHLAGNGRLKGQGFQGFGWTDSVRLQGSAGVRQGQQFGRSLPTIRHATPLCEHPEGLVSLALFPLPERSGVLGSVTLEKGVGVRALEGRFVHHHGDGWTATDRQRAVREGIEIPHASWYSPVCGWCSRFSGTGQCGREQGRIFHCGTETPRRRFGGGRRDSGESGTGCGMIGVGILVGRESSACGGPERVGVRRRYGIRPCLFAARIHRRGVFQQ